jgi:hypothetical protein
VDKIALRNGWREWTHRYALLNRTFSWLLRFSRKHERSAHSGSRATCSRTARRTTGAVRRAEAAAGGTTFVGEVVDTHHPHLPGRVLVRGLDDEGCSREQWLQRERHVSRSALSGVTLGSAGSGVAPAAGARRSAWAA